MLSGIKGFDWDAANQDKNELKHGVTYIECEQIFFNEPLIIVPDPCHSQKEARYAALGKIHSRRHLFVAFTLRRKKIRVISARPMSQKERKVYEQG